MSQVSNAVAKSDHPPAGTVSCGVPDEMASAILHDLARAKALFQARAIAAVLGVPPPSPTRHDIGKDG